MISDHVHAQSSVATSLAVSKSYRFRSKDWPVPLRCRPRDIPFHLERVGVATATNATKRMATGTTFRRCLTHTPKLHPQAIEYDSPTDDQYALMASRHAMVSERRTQRSRVELLIEQPVLCEFVLPGRYSAVARVLIETEYWIAHKRWSETIDTTDWFCTDRTCPMMVGDICCTETQPT